MTKLVTDALVEAVEFARAWHADKPASRPAYDLTVAAAHVAAYADRERPPVIAAGGVIAANRALLDAGELKAIDLVGQSLAAIDRRNDELYAFVEILEVEAREQAAKLDADLAAGRDRGPLHGVPVSVKDLYAVRGGTTRAGSLAYENRDRDDASAVSKLREGGAVIVGKTATHEFAIGVTAPQSRNPHDPSRIAGGSSAGAAIAVATGMGLVALGTDTRGSTRIPAALCGVVGLKPTYGSIALDGVFPLSWTTDHGGVIAKSVADAALTLGVVSEAPQALGGQTKPVREMRIGIPRAAWTAVEAAVEDSVDAALTAFAASGAELVDVDRPNGDDFDRANLMSLIVSRCEAAVFHRDLGLDRALYSPESRSQLDAADGVSAEDYIAAQRFRAQLQQEMLAVFEPVDALLMPTVPMLAPLREDAAAQSIALTRNVALWSFVGFPAVSVPCAPAASGLPVGLQIVAAPHAEAAMIAVGRAIEQGVKAR